MLNSSARDLQLVFNYCLCYYDVTMSMKKQKHYDGALCVLECYKLLVVVVRMYRHSLYDVSDDEDDDVTYLPAITCRPAGDDPTKPVSVLWPSAELRKVAGISKRHQHVTSECDNLVLAYSDHGPVKKAKSLDSPHRPSSPNLRRLRTRRSAVSAGDAISQLGNPLNEDSLESEMNEMPSKKNTFKITARFIGSLQKHSNNKIKAEKAAAAAYMATFLTDSYSKDSDGGIMCDPCSQEDNGVTSDVTKADDLFAMLEKMQGTRMDEQRCSFHITAPPLNNGQAEAALYPSINEVLRRGAPYPQVIPPPHGGYWAQGFHGESPNLETDDVKLTPNLTPMECRLQHDDVTATYRENFIGKEHINLYAFDDTDTIGSLLMSVKYESSEVKGSLGQHRVVLRCRHASWTRCFPITPDCGGPVQWAKSLCEDISIDRFYPVTSATVWQSILQFDEHSLSYTYKFGVLYQRPGQMKEEEVFSNCEESPAFKEFLDFLGDKVPLKGFQGFRGGLDVNHGHTGEHSVHSRFLNKEVMFHVSTYLPYMEKERQQLQRKRHIGNDIVAVVFQDSATPFVPNMITSQFLHAYIVIQAIDPCTDACRYKVSVTCREDVPEFEPVLPEPAVFKKDERFRDWLYCKLMNAEWACYKSEQFAKLQYRTRSMLLDQMYDDIHKGSEMMLGPLQTLGGDNISTSSASSDTIKEGGFFETFKKIKRNQKEDRSGGSPVLSSNRNASKSSLNQDTKKRSPERETHFGGNGFKTNLVGNQHSNDSGVVSEPTNQGSMSSLTDSPMKSHHLMASSPCQSCGSYTSLDSDTGLESIASSSRTDSWPRNKQNVAKSSLVTTATNSSAIATNPAAVATNGAVSTREMEDLRAELNKLRLEKTEFAGSQQELSNLRSEVRRLKETAKRGNDVRGNDVRGNDVNQNPSLVRKLGGALTTTEEHLV